MIQINCSNLKKKYRKEVLFSGFNFEFKSNESYAILGPNSSGKSTLLKIICGMVEATSGSINYLSDNILINEQNWYEFYSFSSPEMELWNELLVDEIITLHFKLKKAKSGQSQILDLSCLNTFRYKTYAELSSGLKNKLKLSLAIFTDTPILFLDEPCTNFDAQNIKWYQEMITKYCSHQMLIIASNQEHEYGFCKHHIRLSDFK